jgi:hypothetical protein
VKGWACLVGRRAAVLVGGIVELGDECLLG